MYTTEDVLARFEVFQAMEYYHCATPLHHSTPLNYFNIFYIKRYA
jgi:hypothetical protein